MDPLTGAIIGGAAMFGGTMLQNEQNSREAGNNRAWQQHMASTAHQRQVADLRAAGLNPILSAGGSGAPVPGGAQATMGNLGESISKGMDTAVAIRSQNKALDLQDMQISKMKDETKNLAAERAMTIPETQMKNAQAQQEQLKTKMLEKTLPAMIKKANAEGNWAEVNQLLNAINSGASSAGQLISPLKLLKGAK